MIVAFKRAVGSDYQFTERIHTVPRKRGKERAKKQVSSSLKTVVGMFLIAVLFCAGLSYLGIKAGLAKMNYEIGNLKKNNQEIALSNDKLKVEIEKLKSLDRIEGLAIANLGMIRSENIEYLVMTPLNISPADAAGGPGMTAIAAAQAEPKGTSTEEKAQLSSGEKFLQKIEMLVFNKG